VAALRAAGAVDVARIGGPAGDVADQHPGAGPLGGVLTALSWSDEQVTVVAPCDLLRPDPATFAALVAGLAPDALAAVPGVERPLPVALRAAAVAPLAAAFAAGERSLHRALRDVAVVTVAVEQTSILDADVPSDLRGYGR
jgi:molybdopterin-guanine dinucleotide biosynthesis protein A